MLRNTPAGDLSRDWVLFMLDVWLCIRVQRLFVVLLKQRKLG